jgi:LPXTG-site transpeptidase (sortase) family protein
MLNFFRGILLLIGITCLLAGGFLFWQQNKPNKFSFNDFKAATDSAQIIPSYLTYKDISLPISTSKIENGRWPLSSESVIYLDGSGVVGKNGNAVIYGHNWKNLLGFLSTVTPGEIIRITTSDNQYADYTIDLVQEVTPDQTHVLSPSDEKKLTLYTCSGFMDKKRLVVIAKMTP